ncbi:1,4-alpha-glucan branching protein GlgB [Paenibacillus segetis]|uniref:1,4-alpha-glucan branching enzyme GlgB n=1 Tax=Paenibacillus segetis TaxID=1325360 RepID=A0ABQ1YFA7_9BACL|nr:1,4-alpha-glucan branching protein GlgB [Paenibacillus segetis]GGH22321.1 1,4-alpha-glucan branching enzyme [Paenibacillus segetis]
MSKQFIQASPVTSNDIYLFHEGTLYRSYHTFGAHLDSENGTEGVRFTVWAPNAQQVGLAADFNAWHGKNDLLYKIPDSGIWTRFFPGLTEGTFYKYEITGPGGEIMLKADPYAFHAEVRPDTASIIQSLDGYKWSDDQWRRNNRNPYQKPINIYEVHFGTWKRKPDGSLFTYLEMADELIPYVKKMGFTHIEIMPITEHPYDLSWGYQTTGYFAPTSRYGSPQDLMYFVDRCHGEGLGVLLDWVPGHFTKDSHGLRMFDGTPLYEYGDPLLAEKPGWGTLSFDFGKPEVRSFLISSALYWLDLYHFDGLRVDAVTSMIRLDFEKSEGQYRLNEQGGVENIEAISFLRQLNEVVFHYYPNVLMMAEESSAWPGVTKSVQDGGLGFNYKWNMGWMNDTLNYIEKSFEERPKSHQLLTFPICYAYSENFTLPLSHDEVVHGKKSLLDKMPGNYSEKFAGLRVLLGYQMTSPGKKLLFMGGEFGQFIEWRDQGELDWFLHDYESHRKMSNYTAALNHLYLSERALWELDHNMEGYQWINPHDSSQSVICYLRKGKKATDTVLVIINFLPVARYNYRVGVPKFGLYKEIFNSDHEDFGGEGRVQHDGIPSERVAWHDQLQSVVMSLPPLSITIWKKTARNNRKHVMLDDNTDKVQAIRVPKKTSKRRIKE